MAPVYPQLPLVQLPLFVFEKRCAHCGETKPADAFSPNKRMRSGLSSWCKHCAARRKVEQRGPPTIRWQNSELVPQGRKWCAHCHVIKSLEDFYPSGAFAYGVRPECKACTTARAMAQYWRKSTDPVYRQRNCVRAATWRTLNRARAQHRDREYYIVHRVEFIERVRAWNAAHPERAYVRRARRRASERSADGSHTLADIRLIRSAQRGLCAYCAQPLPTPCTVDHMTALSRGGSDWPWNLCLACATCNTRKNARSAGQYLAVLVKESRCRPTPTHEIATT